jgi:hypothetical protein
MRQAMEHGSIVPTMFRLALPTVSVLVVQTLVSVLRRAVAALGEQAAISGLTWAARER